MSTSTSVPLDISKATAPLLLGALFNWVLYGILVVQVYVYHRYFPKDKGCNKILVHTIFIIETVQTLLTVADSSYWFISGFGNFERLQRSFVSPVDRPILNSFVAIIVRSFFCYRIWSIKKSTFWWCGVIEALSLVQFTGNMADGILGLKHGNIYVPHVHACFIYTGLVSAAVADIAVTATLTFLLARPLIRELKSSMEHAPRRFVVETNLSSAGLSVICVAIFAAAPNRVYWFFPAVMIGKVYSNTLLASFNNRITLEEHHRNASTYLSITRASTPTDTQEESTRTWAFPDYFVGRFPAAPNDVKSAPPCIVSFDHEKNLEEFPPSPKQQRPFSMQCLHSSPPQYPPTMASPLRNHRIEVPLSTSLQAKAKTKTRSSRKISSLGLPVRPLPPTPSIISA